MRTQPPLDRVLVIRLTASDMDVLERVCRAKERTKAAQVRRLIRRLRGRDLRPVDRPSRPSSA